MNDEYYKRFEEMGNLMEEATNKMIESLNRKKENILKEKIKELGLAEAFELDKKRRFKRFHRIYENQKEHFYFDNGTPLGLRIVTFEWVIPEPIDPFDRICGELRYT